MSSWATGALLSVFGSTCGNLGVNVQKHSLTKEGLRPLQERRPIWKQKEWILGIALIILGSLGDFAALSMVAQSVVAPLGSITLVANICFAHFWLGEHVGWREILGTVFIMTGSTLSVVFGNHANPTYDNQGLLDLISGGLFISYAVVILAILVGGVALHLRISPWKRALVELEAAAALRRMRSGRGLGGSSKRNLTSAVPSASSPIARNNEPMPSASAAVIRRGDDSDSDDSDLEAGGGPAAPPLDPELEAKIAAKPPVYKLTDATLDTGPGVALVPSAKHPVEIDLRELPALRKKFKPYAKFHPFLLCALSGTWGAQSILFSKCFSVLFATSVSGSNQMGNIFPWVCLIGMLICIFTQLYFMSQALSMYDSLYCVPVFQCFFIFISAMGGAAYFREVQNFTLVQSIVFPVGFAITLSGVGILTLRSRKEKKIAVEAQEQSTRDLLAQQKQQRQDSRRQLHAASAAEASRQSGAGADGIGGGGSVLASKAVLRPEQSGNGVLLPRSSASAMDGFDANSSSGGGAGGDAAKRSGADLSVRIPSSSAADAAAAGAVPSNLAPGPSDASAALLINEQSPLSDSHIDPQLYAQEDSSDLVRVAHASPSELGDARMAQQSPSSKPPVIHEQE